MHAATRRVYPNPAELARSQLQATTKVGNNGGRGRVFTRKQKYNYKETECMEGVPLSGDIIILHVNQTVART